MLACADYDDGPEAWPDSHNVRHLAAKPRASTGRDGADVSFTELLQASHHTGGEKRKSGRAVRQVAVAGTGVHLHRAICNRVVF